MNGRIVSLGACVALAFVALATGAPSAGAKEGAKWSATDVEAGRNLLKQVPADLRAGCRFTDVRGDNADPTLIAAVKCELPGDAPADTLSYTWYESKADADAAYDTVASQERDALQADGCGAYSGEYTIDGQDGGRYMCVGLAGATSIVYTYEPFPVVGVITKQHADTADVERMGDFFDNSAGPIQESGRIPSLQTQKFGSKAYKALLAKIPKTIRKHCEPNGDSFTSPWVAFEIQCANPSPGVAFVKYTSYRNDEGFKAAYDADRFHSIHPFKAPASCDDGTWRVHKKRVGSYACAVDNGDDDGSATFMIWTVDQDRIVAAAYANQHDMSTDDFVQWWNDDAGPLL